jgi:hypothetical protein
MNRSNSKHITAVKVKDVGMSSIVIKRCVLTNAYYLMIPLFVERDDLAAPDRKSLRRMDMTFINPAARYTRVHVLIPLTQELSDLIRNLSSANSVWLATEHPTVSSVKYDAFAQWKDRVFGYLGAYLQRADSDVWIENENDYYGLLLRRNNIRKALGSNKRCKFRGKSTTTNTYSYVKRTAVGNYAYIDRYTVLHRLYIFSYGENQ